MAQKNLIYCNTFHLEKMIIDNILDFIISTDQSRRISSSISYSFCNTKNHRKYKQ